MNQFLENVAVHSMCLPCFKTLIAVVLLVGSCAIGQESKPVDDLLLPTGRQISPAGKTLAFYGRPVDLEIFENTLFVKNHKQLKAIDAESFQEIASVSIAGGASPFGIGCDDSGRIYVTNATNLISVFNFADNKFDSDRTIELPKGCFPCGFDFSRDFKSLYVCLSKKNTLAEIDVDSGKLKREIAVGIAPFDCHVQGKLLFVSNSGGRRATTDELTASSAGTEVAVDERGIANNGTLSIVDLEKGVVIREIRTGLLPTVVDGNKTLMAACNSNEDTITLIDPADLSVKKQLNVKPDEKLPFGSMPSCVHFVKDKMMVTLAGNNAVAIYETGTDASCQLVGQVPTAWYPGSIASNDKFLFIGSIKGFGARAKRRDEEKGGNSHDHQGVIQRIALSELTKAENLVSWEKQINENSRLPQIIRNRILQSPDGNTPPKPIPEKLGEPSLFKHVIYVIKENRTFDQVFGDYAKARSEPKLCIFPRDKTPNHHALADRFGILDNYYCNGVLSADGHSWATEGNVTPYLERSFGGFSRSYTFGNDPLTYSSSGFIWDHILAAGLSFRNYGEFNYAKIPNGMKYQEVFQKYKAGEHIEFGHNIGVKRVRDYSCLDYPGWNMDIPDVLRMDRFLKEFRQFEKDGSLPNFCILYLPEDHLGAKGITSNAHMADNDLALGRLVEAVSESKFWKDTVIFVNEDDPQNGFDHIDGHRSICLVISPYSRKGINHSFYNQTSVLRTILHIFGLPPMNQQDASAPLMNGCFSNVANLEPYVAITPETKLNESVAEQSSWTPAEKKWREIVATVPISRTGMKTEQDEDNLNRFIWHEAKGWSTPYPVKFAGAHALGLNRLKLKLELGENE